MIASIGVLQSSICERSEERYRFRDEIQLRSSHQKLPLIYALFPSHTPEQNFVGNDSPKAYLALTCNTNRTSGHFHCFLALPLLEDAEHSFWSPILAANPGNHGTFEATQNIG
ncbi:uncharacterized protein PHALS_04760 [Plasmopara halstedii]|uniref:Uncharacterized protein n=1 Tax=Plasmopara halstedii TaxID=4781 RepID=A0A0P1AZ36_PLAHL|nr:uncharacterized protein PHALS_04760 [Plasmopara halstedii]CEG47610.1 hypothetical protein PHALS_04760 [Plasmopara halstedii]|eukprot:XP_024583979.1 hypothetical protein PHALS_04760 [Plasmopara halstedii]